MNEIPPDRKQGKDLEVPVWVGNIFMELAHNNTLRKSDRRILNYLLAKLSFEDWNYMTNRDISEALGIEESSVGKSVQILVKEGQILKQWVGRNRYLRISSLIVVVKGHGEIQ